MPPTPERLAEAAARAVTAWELDVADLSLVSLSENAVFRVDTEGGGPLILRLHRPGYNTRSEMDSELAWVAALRESGLDAPAARLTPGGEGYVEVDVCGDDGSVVERRLAGMIEWVDGVDLGTLSDEDPSAVATHFGGVGRLLATIRRHGSSWRPPPDFVRRRWDAAGLMGPDPLWGRFWEVPDDPGQRAVLAGARDALFARLSDLPTGRPHFGLIHADLHLRNVLVDADRLTVIDFDDSGHGWYVHEIGVTLHMIMDEPWYDEAREALLAGYQGVHPLTEQELALLPAFLTVRSLMLVSWLAARPELAMYEYLPQIVANGVAHAERYLSDPSGS